ncbi:DUF2813 domain-containing protein [Kocuria coralli]|uniref:DUF2813 domain-containing protein n=1 Tax=Kocuria coralli TaxID=1461025 RepID=A0A5J5L341_9MICC|nr:ATP-binding protein [Kocuria coralli]KAA9395506.1 DUF2813 domain-containing protein [Kocuria coralli]
MRLHRIQLENFKGVTHREVTFPDTGIAVLIGPNEAGKSSIIEALDLLLETVPTSKSKAVLSARPEGRDVGVCVEAEFTVNEHRLRYRKRWLKSTGAELEYVAGPSAGRTATGRQAHDAVQELLDGSDRTLWNALRLLQSGARSDDFSGSTALRQALEAGGGHEADDAAVGTTVLAAARAERARYFTDHGREKAETLALRRRYRDCTERHEEAEQRLREIAAAVDTYDRKTSEARRAKEAVTSARADLETAGQAAAEVEELKRRRDAAGVALEVATDHAGRAVQDQNARASLVERLDRSARDLEQLGEDLSELRETAAQQEEAAATARGALGEAREAERTARAAEQRARAAEQRTRDAERLAELETLLADLDALAQEARTLGRHEPSGITSSTLESLEHALRAVELAEMQLQAGSAQVTVTALGQQPSATVDGIALGLETGEALRRAVTETVTVEVPRSIRVVVEPEDGLSSRQAVLRRAADALESALAAAGVATVREAREALERDRENERRVGALKERRRLVLQRRDETALREEHRTLAAALGGENAEKSGDGAGPGNGPDPALPPDAPGTGATGSADLPALRVAVEEAAALAEEARESSLRCEQALQRADTAAGEARTVLARAITEVESGQRVLADHSEQLQEARSKASDASLTAAVEETAAAQAAAQATVTDLETRWAEANAEQVLGLARGHQTRLDHALAMLETAQAERSRAEGALDGLDRDARQREYDAALTEARAVARELTAHLRRAAAAGLLADTLEDYQAQAHRRYNAPFRRQLESLGRTVFGSTFEVELADDLTITRRGLKGTWLEVSALSTGAREQLDVLIRLAVATLVDPDDGVPVILDDTLGHSDPNRLVSLSSALEAAGTRAQVILLTATPDRFASVPGATTIRVDDPARG